MTVIDALLCRYRPQLAFKPGKRTGCRFDGAFHLTDGPLVRADLDLALGGSVHGRRGRPQTEIVLRMASSDPATLPSHSAASGFLLLVIRLPQRARRNPFCQEDLGPENLLTLHTIRQSGLTWV